MSFQSDWFKGKNSSLNIKNDQFSSCIKETFYFWKFTWSFHQRFQSYNWYHDKPFEVYSKENLTWIYHIPEMNNQILKKYKKKSIYIPNKELLKQFYFGFINLYLNSDGKSKWNLLILLRHQKHLRMFIFDKWCCANAKLKVFIVYLCNFYVISDRAETQLQFSPAYIKNLQAKIFPEPVPNCFTL